MTKQIQPASEQLYQYLQSQWNSAQQSRTRWANDPVGQLMLIDFSYANVVASFRFVGDVMTFIPGLNVPGALIVSLTSLLQGNWKQAFWELAYIIPWCRWGKLAFVIGKSLQWYGRIESVREGSANLVAAVNDIRENGPSLANIEQLASGVMNIVDAFRRGSGCFVPLTGVHGQQLDPDGEQARMRALIMLLSATLLALAIQQHEQKKREQKELDRLFANDAWDELWHPAR